MQPGFSLYPLSVASLSVGEDISLPKEQMKQLHDVLTSSFFKSVKEVGAGGWAWKLQSSTSLAVAELWDVVPVGET